MNYCSNPTCTTQSFLHTDKYCTQCGGEMSEFVGEEQMEERMTDAEFGVRCQQLGVEKGRLQVAVELSEWATRHLAILTSPAAKDLAKDLIDKCRQIIQDVKVKVE